MVVLALAQVAAAIVESQHYGSAAVDVSLLRLPALGFLPAADPRMAGTLDAITRYAHDQGLTSRRIPLDELFVPSTLSLAKV